MAQPNICILIDGVLYEPTKGLKREILNALPEYDARGMSEVLTIAPAKTKNKENGRGKQEQRVHGSRVPRG